MIFRIGKQDYDHHCIVLLIAFHSTGCPTKISVCDTGHLVQCIVKTRAWPTVPVKVVEVNLFTTFSVILQIKIQN